jgi:hypothetical protein
MSSSVLFWHVKVEKIVNATTGGNAAGGVPATLPQSTGSGFSLCWFHR